jgi:hypothetical protein
LRRPVCFDLEVVVDSKKDHQENSMNSTILPKLIATTKITKGLPERHSMAASDQSGKIRKVILQPYTQRALVRGPWNSPSRYLVSETVMMAPQEVAY